MLRLVTPRRHGGADRPLPEVVDLLAALAVENASLAWMVGQVALTQAIVRHFPRATQDAIFAAGPDMYGAGAIAPKGRAERAPGGWIVTGQWPFVTGCRNAAWIYLQCMVIENRRPARTEEGAPKMRLALVGAEDVEIHDTWRSLGLRGTGSHDVSVRRVFVPDDRTCDLAAGSPVDSTDSSLDRLPLGDYAGLFIAPVALGIATAAIQVVSKLAQEGKRPAFSPMKLSECAVFRTQLGEAHMELRSAQALLRERARAAWQATELADRQSTLERAALRATSRHVTRVAQRLLDRVFVLAGGSAVYDACPLERHLRDVHTATQHAWNADRHAEIVGAALATDAAAALLF